MNSEIIAINGKKFELSCISQPVEEARLPANSWTLWVEIKNLKHIKYELRSAFIKDSFFIDQSAEDKKEEFKKLALFLTKRGLEKNSIFSDDPYIITERDVIDYLNLKNS